MIRTVENLQKIIDGAFEKRAELSPHTAAAEIIDAVGETLSLLNNGTLRVATPAADGDGWVVHEWSKKPYCFPFAFLITVSWRRETRYFDKVSLKFSRFEEEDFNRLGARVVPPATVRHGAYIAPNVVLMPYYVNIGAYVDSAAMVDTWATVGSCAQIGKNVHLSGGVGIGGVLEPLQAMPTIIEDDCFIGARSEVVEGVVVGRGAVLSMGVFIGQSTRLYDRQSGKRTTVKCRRIALWCPALFLLQMALIPCLAP